MESVRVQVHTMVNSGTRVCPTKPPVSGFNSQRSMNMTIRIDRYETVLENGRITYYAIAGKKKYPMPEAFKDMYDDSHLAIREAHNDRPEMYGIPTTDYYIPLFTGVTCDE